MTHDLRLSLDVLTKGGGVTYTGIWETYIECA